MRRRRHRITKIPEARAAVVGANIRVLRQRNGWTQARLGELMGWRSSSTVCAAEGRRSGRQRGFTQDEVQRLAGIFGIRPWQLTTRCANCDGHPPRGFTCESCGAREPREQGRSQQGSRRRVS
jgi:transcriptional regulator with XRE-family HTH domain